MESNALHETKRELLKEMDQLKREYKAYKRRASVIANLFIPGIGFVIYGSSYLKGLVSFVLYLLYNLLFFIKILPNTDIGIAVIYYIPALIILVASTAMVAGLDD